VAEPGEPQQRSTASAGPIFLAAGLIAVVAVAVLLWPAPQKESAEAEPGAPLEAPAAAPAPGKAASADSPKPHPSDVSVPASEKVPSGATVWVTRAAWDAADPPVLTLDIGAPQTEARPLAVTISAFQDSAILAATETAPVAAGETEARLPLPAQAPTPGRYLIQVKTTERNHFPLRRYVLEVR